MESRSELCLDVAGRQVTVQIRKESPIRSSHTGLALTELHGVVTTGSEQTHAWLSEVLPTLAEEVFSATDAAGERAGRWMLSWNAYTVNAGIHTYSVILREAEDLTLEALQVDGIELFPYEYREKLVGTGLALWAKLVGSEKDVIRMRQLVTERRVFPVVRRGIQDEPRQMRLGVAEWSHFEDRIKYRIVLLDEGLSSELAGELVLVEEQNSRAAISYYANLLERLTEHLIEKGILAEAEVAAMRAAAGAEPSVTRHELWRVPDVDAL